MRILAEAGAQLKAFPPTPQWPRTPRGLWSGSNFLKASLCLPWDLLGLSRGWSRSSRPSSVDSRTCQRCWAPGVGRGKGGPCIHAKGICAPPPLRQPALLLAPFLQAEALSDRRATRPPPRAGLLCSALCQRARLACALGPDVSASEPVSRETLLHGDGLPGRHTPFLWAWAAAHAGAGKDGNGWGE